MRWWDDADQAFAEQPVVHHRDLGKGWIPVPMVNNTERLDPYGDDPASEAVRSARSARTLTALDEGAAWRRRRDSALLVARVEVFAAPDDGSHRQAWQAEGERCLDALWRARWRERDREPGWIEARWRAVADRPDELRPGGQGARPEADAVDWLTIEDHTGADEAHEVTAYEHVTLWADRALITLILRHRHGDDADAVVSAAVAAAQGRAASLSRRSGPALGSA